MADCYQFFGFYRYKQARIEVGNTKQTRFYVFTQNGNLLFLEL